MKLSLFLGTEEELGFRIIKLKMFSGLQNEERSVPEHLKKQLAIGVRNIQWSYAIFWSISTRQQGVLEWCEGYYNGDIKTRKTFQAVELNPDQLGLQRSEDLRELYKSLPLGDSARRPSSALSPEDLSDAEWYYLVCMSFVFNLGQGLPGRAFANGQPIWLYNAHAADSKVFGRSLLARSASIKSVVCFPFLGGVIELGVSDLVLEDHSLIQRFKMSVLNIPNPNTAPKKSDRNGQDPNLSTPSNNSDDLELNQRDDSFAIEGINGAVSRAPMDDELSNSILNSTDSSDCISQTLVAIPKHEMFDDQPLQDLLTEDLHYLGVIATLFKNSNQLILGPHFQDQNKESSFARWKRGGFRKKVSKYAISQRLVKKILFEVPQMHVKCVVDSPEDNQYVDENGVCKPEADDVGANHALSERKRRERLNEKFLVLKTMVPSLNKDDKVSVLDDAIEYLKELEKRVGELESCRETINVDPKTVRKPCDDAREGTSDNYGSKKSRSCGKKQLINKRKASGIDEGEAVLVPEMNHHVRKGALGDDNVAVKMKNKDVVIELKCRWRAGVLLEIMNAMSDLHLDSHSVQSTTVDGIISLTIKSMIKGSTPISLVTIKQALQRVTRKC